MPRRTRLWIMCLMRLSTSCHHMISPWSLTRLVRATSLRPWCNLFIFWLQWKLLILMKYVDITLIIPNIFYGCMCGCPMLFICGDINVWKVWWCASRESLVFVHSELRMWKVVEAERYLDREPLAFCMRWSACVKSSRSRELHQSRAPYFLYVAKCTCKK
jgi:hypothetical protein